MDKQYILAEIKRTAAANGGKPLGVRSFANETGIKEADWFGKYWARWGDALAEAGFAPNELRGAYPKDVIYEKIVALTRELGRFPARGDLMLRSRTDKSFPSAKTFQRRGSKAQLVQKVREYCEGREGYEDVLALCREPVTEQPEADPSSPFVVGFVYLLKFGRSYKIGKSNAVGRRERELAIQLPDKTRTVHVIRTDDPSGIEAYWHARFEAKRKNGEWFDLDATDIAAFKRRKFM